VLAEREFACCRGFQAHLVLEAGDVHPVTITELAGLGIEQVLGTISRLRPVVPGPHLPVEPALSAGCSRTGRRYRLVRIA